MRGNKIYLACLAILLCLAIGVGVLTRFSYAQDTSVGNYLDRAEQYKLSLDNSNIKIYFDNQIGSISRLKEKSDLIIRARAGIDRLDYARAILSGVDVLEVYKGSDIKKGEHIYLYEPSNFYGVSYFVVGGYNIMQSGQEYILFLKHLKIPRGYKYRGNEAVSFMPVSSYYSKYPVKSAGTVTPVNGKLVDQGALSFRDVKDYEIITEDKNIIARYIAFREEALKMK